MHAPATLLALGFAGAILVLSAVGVAHTVQQRSEAERHSTALQLAEELAEEVRNRVWDELFPLEEWAEKAEARLGALGFEFHIEIRSEGETFSHGPEPPPSVSSVLVFSGVKSPSGLTTPGWIEVSVW